MSAYREKKFILLLWSFFYTFFIRAWGINLYSYHYLRCLKRFTITYIFFLYSPCKNTHSACTVEIFCVSDVFFFCYYWVNIFLGYYFADRPFFFLVEHFCRVGLRTTYGNVFMIKRYTGTSRHLPPTQTIGLLPEYTVSACGLYILCHFSDAPHCLGFDIFFSFPSAVLQEQ